MIDTNFPGTPTLKSIIPSGAAAHNAVFRGAGLAGRTVDEICAKIQDGTFEDLFIGDYFDINITVDSVKETVRCVLAGFDMYLHNGDQGQGLTQHHAVIVPKNCFAKTAQMNSTNTTGVSANTANPVSTSVDTGKQKGAYLGSDMNQIVLPKYAAALTTVLGARLLQFRDLLSSKTASGASMAGTNWQGYTSAWEWTPIKLRLLSEVQLYGSTVFSSSFYDVGAANLQLPLFQLNPAAKVCKLGGTDDITNSRCWWWLSSIASSANFAGCNTNGLAASGYASTSGGVRPLFLIG